jgi:hypothetical protein
MKGLNVPAGLSQSGFAELRLENKKGAAGATP